MDDTGSSRGYLASAFCISHFPSTQWERLKTLPPVIQMKTILALFLLTTVLSFAQRPTKHTPITIPVRDGNSLAADLYAISLAERKPTILIQTPYNKDLYRLTIDLPPQAGGKSFPYDSVKYNYVIVDWRGFYGSKSAAVTGYDRGLDGFDVVEWIAKQPWSDGKVGTWGPSALGAIQFQTAKHHPPHLVCSVPLVKDFKTKYSDYFYGGAFRKEHVESLVKLGFFVSTNLILDHPSEDFFWKIAEAGSDYPDSIAIPMLLVTGWFDHFPDDVIRAFDDLQKRSDPSVRSKHKLLVGPWLHSGIDRQDQGQLSYPNAVDVANEWALAFFGYYLRGENNGYPARRVVQYYALGSGGWFDREWTSNTIPIKWYLHPDKTLRWSVPQTSSIDPDTITYNPRDPSPAVGGSRFNPFDRTIPIGPQDISQSVQKRSDALTFTTSGSMFPFFLIGKTSVNLFISSNRLDTDFSVRLCDLYPDGRSIILTQGIRRARFRNSLSKEELLQPGQIYPITIELQQLALEFQLGHRLQIVLSCSDYPHFDINPNNGGPLYKAGDTLIATNLLYHDESHPSHVEMEMIHGGDHVFDPVQSPSLIRLFAPFPNPATSTTQVSFSITAKEGRGITIELFDRLGRRVNVVADRFYDKGSYAVPLDCSRLQPGIYFIRLSTNEVHQIKPLCVFR